MVMLGIIIVIINNDGSKTIVDAPDNAAVTVTPVGSVKIEPAQGVATQERPASPVQVPDTEAEPRKKGYLTAFPEGAIYKGTFKNIKRDGSPKVESELTMTIKRRDGDKYESEWHLHHWNHTWYAVGSITANSEGPDTADGEFTNLIQESHPSEGGNVMTIAFSPDRMSFTGAKRQLTGISAGSTNEFEATLVNAEELGLIPDPIPLGSKWTGTLLATHPRGPATTVSASAVVTRRTKDEFGVRVKCRDNGKGAFYWEYQCEQEGDAFKIAKVVLEQSDWNEPDGEKLFSDNKVSISEDEMLIMLSRPIPEGNRQQTLRLTRESDE